MKSICINLITAPTVRMPLIPHRLHKILIIAAIALFLSVMIYIAGGLFPLLSHVSDGALATLTAPFQ